MWMWMEVTRHTTHTGTQHHGAVLCLLQSYLSQRSGISVSL